MSKRALKAAEAKRLAEIDAENARVAVQCAAFAALPDCPAKTRLVELMTNRLIDLCNNVQFEAGDEILQFLPDKYARQFLDWYFHESDEFPELSACHSDHSITPTATPPDNTCSTAAASETIPSATEPRGDQQESVPLSGGASNTNSLSPDENERNSLPLPVTTGAESPQNTPDGESPVPSTLAADL